MFDKDYFAEKEVTEPSKAGKFVGGAGNWGLHIAKLMFLAYSGYHGVSASLNYAGSSELAKGIQIFGIVVLEMVLLSVYMAWHNQRIVGTVQSIIAIATYAVGFILACLGIVADSQLHSGVAMSSWLVTYLQWGLPIAPAVMALGSVLVHVLAPEQLRLRKQSNELLDFQEEQFKAHMLTQRADLETAMKIKNMQLNAKQQAASIVFGWLSSAEAQDAILATAKSDAPRLLAAAGFDIPTGQKQLPASAAPLQTGDVSVNAGDMLDLRDLVEAAIQKRMADAKDDASIIIPEHPQENGVQHKPDFLAH